MDLAIVARHISDLDDLLRGLVLQINPSNRAARVFRPRIDTACEQIQILRMLISMGRSTAEQLAASRDLAATLRLGDVMASRSRLSGELRQAIRLAATLAAQICRGLELSA